MIIDCPHTEAVASYGQPQKTLRWDASRFLQTKRPLVAQKHTFSEGMNDELGDGDLKRKEIVQFIRESILSEEFLDEVVEMVVDEFFDSMEMNISKEDAISRVKKVLLSDALIDLLVKGYDEVFTLEEIRELSTIYTSNVYKKMLQNMASLFDFTAIFELAEELTTETLQPYSTEKSAIDEMNQEVVSVSEENFSREVLHCCQPVVLSVTVSWCASCQKSDPIFAALCKRFGHKVKFAQLDADVDEKIAETLGVDSYPTFLFIEDGEVIDQMTDPINNTEEFLSKLVQAFL